METLNQITQSHLSILVLDKNSHNPIARMPVYAEISIIETKTPYTISPNDLSIHLEPQVADLVRALLPLHLDESQFRSLSPELREKLLNRIVKLLTGDLNPFQHPEQEWKAIIDKAIIQALTELDLPTTNQAVKQAIYSYPLGYLATDHVGYASFDLTKFPEGNIFDNSNFNTPSKLEYAVFVYPMGKDGSRLDVLEQARLTKDAIFAKLSIEPPVFEVDLKALNLPSMQKPSLVDWYFSPGSFASKPEFLVGEDGCEQLFPAQLALQQFNFRQVVRVGKAPDGFNIPPEFKFGYVDEYRASWYSLGHSLGEILYSLPLAPGESVKLAVIDWSWDSLTKRDETTKLTEEVLHQTHRDRTITETVKATLEEWQRGGSFMGGMAVSASIPVGDVLISGANSLGGAYSTSSGSRDLAAENVQRLSDGFSQASSAQREINSTVVIQARQEEKESIQTRTFTNYNHSHTLTILYYEVLRHFKVEVEWVRRKPVLLKEEPPIYLDDLGNNHILLYRSLVEPNLLDPSLIPAFDVIAKLVAQQEYNKFQGINPAQQPAHVYGERATSFKAFYFAIKTGDAGSDSEKEISAVLRDATNSVARIKLFGSNSRAGEWDELNANLGQRFLTGQTFSSFLLRADKPVVWGELIGFEIRNTGVADDWNLVEFGVWGVVADTGLIALHQSDPDSNFQRVSLYFRKDKQASEIILARPPGADPAQPGRPKTPEQTLSPEELRLVNGLKMHLKAFAAYYQRLIYLTADPNDNARNFISQPFGTTNTKWLDHIEPTPLEMFGNHIAYPLIEEGVVTDQFIKELFNETHSNDPDQQKRAIGKLVDLSEQQLEQVATVFAMKKAKAEKLITLPTRGVFAEGKLGHCNISEEIDNTRYWKWEEHPIPFEAPGINPVTPVTPQPQQTNIAPTAFPTSLVNIVNPSPAPDPTGLSDALKVLATPNIFRDMSGRTEVADLLKKLSDNTISFQDAANKAREIQGKYGSDLSGGAGGSGVSSGGAGGSNKSGTSAGTSGADELSKRVDAVKSMVGYGDPKDIKDVMTELAKIAKKPSIFDEGAIASNGITSLPSSNTDQPELIAGRFEFEINGPGLNGPEIAYSGFYEFLPQADITVKFKGKVRLPPGNWEIGLIQNLFNDQVVTRYSQGGQISISSGVIRSLDTVKDETDIWFNSTGNGFIKLANTNQVSKDFSVSLEYSDTPNYPPIKATMDRCNGTITELLRYHERTLLLLVCLAARKDGQLYPLLATEDTFGFHLTLTVPNGGGKPENSWLSFTGFYSKRNEKPPFKLMNPLVIDGKRANSAGQEQLLKEFERFSKDCTKGTF